MTHRKIRHQKLIIAIAVLSLIAVSILALVGISYTKGYRLSPYMENCGYFSSIIPSNRNKICECKGFKIERNYRVICVGLGRVKTVN